MRTPPVLEFLAVTRRWHVGPLGATQSVIGLERCSFTAAPGEIIALYGPAGGGKSTALLVASGRVPAHEGLVRWCAGPDPSAARPQLVGARPWEYGFLTVRQALAFHADVLSLQDAALPAPTRYLPLLRDVGLRGMSRVRLGALAPLDQLRVVIAQALLSHPKLLCLDDPFVFCTRPERIEGIALLRRLADRGLAILIAGRDAEACGGQGTADVAIRLEAGRRVGDGGPRRTVLELSVPSPEEAMLRLASALPSVARRGRRLRVPLGGTSPEEVLAACRAAGVSVRGSRVAEEAVGRRRS